MEEFKMELKVKKDFNYIRKVMVKAPGRVNIIGEHVDYPQFKDGAHNFSLPFSAQFSIRTRIEKTTDLPGIINARSNDFKDSFVFRMDDIDNLQKTTDPNQSWRNYLLGVLSTAKEKNLPFFQKADIGLNIGIGGDIPIGAGMSSSAAMCVGLTAGLNELFSWNMSKIEIAKIAQLAEHSRFVGVKCGLLDQMASLFGEKGKAVLIDYGDMEHVRPVSLDPIFNKGYKFLVVNSGVPRGLGGTFYNDRRDELIELGSLWAKAANDIEMDHISMHSFNEYDSIAYLSLKERAEKENIQPEKFEMLFKRGYHVLSEKQRTLDFVKAANKGDVSLCCDLINECGFSLSGKGSYNISGTVIRDAHGNVIEVRPYLDILKGGLLSSFKNSHKNVGARMLGGGGGGCELILMPEAYDTNSWRDKVATEYRKNIRDKYQQDLEIEFYEAEPSDGVRAFTFG
jgi:galactokinase